MTKHYENGTPQGSVLRPLLFSLMINISQSEWLLLRCTRTIFAFGNVVRI